MNKAERINNTNKEMQRFEEGKHTQGITKNSGKNQIRKHQAIVAYIDSGFIIHVRPQGLFQQLNKCLEASMPEWMTIREIYPDSEKPQKGTIPSSCRLRASLPTTRKILTA